MFSVPCRLLQPCKLDTLQLNSQFRRFYLPAAGFSKTVLAKRVFELKQVGRWRSLTPVIKELPLQSRRVKLKA